MRIKNYKDAYDILNKLRLESPYIEHTDPDKIEKLEAAHTLFRAATYCFDMYFNEAYHNFHVVRYPRRYTNAS